MGTQAVSLPDLKSEFSVDAKQISAFRRGGCVLLRAVASTEEVAKFRPVILTARDRQRPEPVSLEQGDTYGEAILKGLNLWTMDEGVRRFALSRRFAKIAAELLGVKGVRIYHDQALLKEAGSGIIPWHQDQHYWPLGTSQTIVMWMPLLDMSPDMGTLRFAVGSYREGNLGDRPLSDESEVKLEALIRKRGFTVVQSPAMKAGDATFYYGWTLHGAPGNSTRRTSEVMTISWFEDGARVTAPDNPNRAQDLDRWLPGLKPGDLAASNLNPLCWSAEGASMSS